MAGSRRKKKISSNKFHVIFKYFYFQNFFYLFEKSCERLNLIKVTLFNYSKLESRSEKYICSQFVLADECALFYIICLQEQ